MYHKTLSLTIYERIMKQDRYIYEVVTNIKCVEQCKNKIKSTNTKLTEKYIPLIPLSTKIRKILLF